MISLQCYLGMIYTIDTQGSRNVATPLCCDRTCPQAVRIDCFLIEIVEVGVNMFMYLKMYTLRQSNMEFEHVHL